jgi:hypothetical protein
VERSEGSEPSSGRGANSRRHALLRCNAADGKGFLLRAECTGVYRRAREGTVVGPYLGNGRKRGVLTGNVRAHFISGQRPIFLVSALTAT